MNPGSLPPNRKPKDISNSSINKNNTLATTINKTRKQIYGWLKSLPVSALKEIFTVKNPANVGYLQRILYPYKGKEEWLPAKIATSGFVLQSTGEIYHRENYHYRFYSGFDKIKNKEVERVALELAKNLTIMRVHPHSISVSHSYLMELESTMDTLSKGMILQMSVLEYFYKINQSMWFDLKEFHSLPEWIVYMFECEIKEAYINKKQNPHTFYSYIVKSYSEHKKVEKMFESTIVKFCSSQKNKNEPNSANFKNSINFYMTKCTDRLKQEYDQYEYLIEHNWYHDSKNNSEIMQILTNVCENLYEEFEEWKVNRVLYEILEEEENRKNKKKNKKSKSKKDKDKEKDKEKKLEKDQDGGKSEKSNEKEKVERDEQDLTNLEQVKRLREEIEKEIEETMSKVGYDQIQTETNQKNVQQAAKIEEKQEEKSEQIIEKQEKPKIKEKQESKKQPSTKTKIKTKKITKKALEDLPEEKIHGIQVSESASEYSEEVREKNFHKNQMKNPNKKIIKQRINEYYQFFVDGLSQEANNLEKYRKLVVKIVQNFIEMVIIGKSEIKWSLKVYGSAAAGFSLKQSDIDLVLLVNSNKLSLMQMAECFKAQPWAMKAQFIPATVPLISFGVNLGFSEVARNELQPKQLKRMENQIFSVDLGLSSLENPHSGIQNTNNLRDLFTVYPPLRTICLLFKQFLRRRSLNKPYKGGISSYVLTILIYSILHRQNMLGSDKSDYSTQIKEITKFMVTKFEPFQTVISSSKQNITKPDPTLHLNIEDPKSKKLLKTSAFKIEKIIMQLNCLEDFQRSMEQQLQKIPIQESKNMKKAFLKYLQEFMEENMNEEENTTE